MTFFIAVLTLLSSPLFALEPLVAPSAAKGVGDVEVKADSTPVKTSEVNAPNKVLPGEPTARKNYLLPALEIPVFLLALNGYDRLRYGMGIYGTGYQSFKNHVLHGKWEYDEDPFSINQFAHPYQGALMYGFARSSGLNFWEGLLYSNAGSLLWKLAGETGNPSLNDQITTGNAGSIFGEELYRMGSLVLERGSVGGEKPAAWREWCAAIISPPTGLNRVLFGDRYKWMESRDPATFTRLSLGQSFRSDVTDSVAGAHETIPQAVAADFSMEYGLPGKDGYRYIRPLDYFAFQITGAAKGGNSVENVMTRGLLFGSKYEAGEAMRGVWGFYGSYDYITPQVFRVSSTAGSLGTTAQWRIASRTVLQGTALVGLGFGAAGSARGIGERNYHYGATPQGLLALRLILGDRLMLDSTTRQYFVTRLGGSEDANEDVTRVDAGATLRISGHQAVSASYVYSRREARYPGITGRRQSVGSVAVAYSLIGDPHFGAVEWR